MTTRLFCCWNRTLDTSVVNRTTLRSNVSPKCVQFLFLNFTVLGTQLPGDQATAAAQQLRASFAIKKLDKIPPDFVSLKARGPRVSPFPPTKKIGLSHAERIDSHTRSAFQHWQVFLLQTW